MLLGAVAAGLLLTSLDAYVVASLLFPMLTDTGVPLDHLERATPVLSAFFFGYVTAIPVFGPLSDARGRVAVYVGGLAVFAAGSAVTAQAQDLTGLIAGRALQGFAGGALIPVALAVVADTFPGGAARLVALGVAAGAQELGSLAGPLYGVAVSRWLADQGAWRAVFLANVALAALCAVAFAVAARGAGLGSGRTTRLTLPAALALSAGMGLLVLGLSPDDPARSALSSHWLPLGLGAAAALALFAWLQWRGAPLIAPLAGRAAALGAGAVTNLLAGAALVAALAEVPLLARTLFGLDDVASALLLARFLAGVAVGAVLGGLLGGRSRRLPAAAGLALATVAFVRMSGWDALEPAHRLGLFADAHVVLFGCGLGFGLAIAPIVAAILEAASGAEHGAAASLAVLARMAGMLVGVALLAAYGLHRFYGDLAVCAPGGFGLSSVVGGSFQACAASALRAQYHDVFIIAAVVAGLGALLALIGLPPSTGFKVGAWPTPSTSR